MKTDSFSKVKVRLLSKENKDILSNLMQFYHYDFTDFGGERVNDRGKFFYKHLDTYWSEKGRYPFIIKFNGEIAGFCLVNRHSLLKNTDVHVIAEFLILRYFRRQKIGLEAAKQIFQLFPGNWEVFQTIKNIGAQGFWLNCIESIVGAKYERLELNERVLLKFSLNNEVRDEISKVVSKISPYDTIEKQHVNEVLSWIESGEQLFRIKKPDFPDKHLVSYFCLVDFNNSKLLLVEHKNAGLWLPSGGHVEPGESPKTTVARECFEELKVTPRFWSEEPFFVTSSMTVGATAGHTDISLWYVLEGNSTDEYDFDRNEFHSVKWFGFDEIPFNQADPNLKRFIEKLKQAKSL